MSLRGILERVGKLEATRAASNRTKPLREPIDWKLWDQHRQTELKASALLTPEQEIASLQREIEVKDRKLAEAQRLGQWQLPAQEMFGGYLKRVTLFRIAELQGADPAEVEDARQRAFDDLRGNRRFKPEKILNEPGAIEYPKPVAQAPAATEPPTPPEQQTAQVLQMPKRQAPTKPTSPRQALPQADRMAGFRSGYDQRSEQEVAEIINSTE